MKVSRFREGGQAWATAFISSTVSSRGSTTLWTGSFSATSFSAAGKLMLESVDQCTSPANPVCRTRAAIARSCTMTASGPTWRASWSRIPPTASSSSGLIKVLRVT